MITAPPACKMVAAPLAVKTAKDRSQAQGAVKGRGKVFESVVARSTACTEGNKRD